MTKLLLLLLVLALTLPFMTPSETANAAPPEKPDTLWGIDEDDGVFFSIKNYTKIISGAGPAGLVIYGDLKYDNDGTITPLPNDPATGGHIGSIALDGNGVAYMALNFDLEFDISPDLDAPVLLKFDTADAKKNADNVVEVVGTIGIDGTTGCSNFDEPDDDNISGLSFDPLTGNTDLYALYRVRSTPALDLLIVIDPADASVKTNFPGANGCVVMTGVGEAVEDGEDLEFNQFGSLYVTDDFDKDLYLVEPSSGAILEEIENVAPADLGVAETKIEGLGWDSGLQQMIGSEDLNELFFIHSLELAGQSEALGGFEGLTDVEAIDFINTPIEQLNGRMTGGGFQFDAGGARISRGFTIHCDITLSNNLELNWPDNKWHIIKPLDSAVCEDIDDPTPPAAPFSRFIGEGTGKLNGVAGSIVRFVFDDKGEPGTSDRAKIEVWAPGDDPDLDPPVFSVDALLGGGNIQAHFDQPHK